MRMGGVKIRHLAVGATLPMSPSRILVLDRQSLVKVLADVPGRLAMNTTLSTLFRRTAGTESSLLTRA